MAQGPMRDPSSVQTSPTLLGRLRQQPSDQAAWGQFVDRYSRAIYGWARQGLQDADAEDVTQMVLVRLAEHMRSFSYDPTRSFRGWLRRLTQHAWSDFVTAQKRGGRASGDSTTAECLLQVPARDDLVARLEEQFDREVLEEAQARVQLRVETDSWQAFQLTALEGLSGAEAAQRLNKQVTAVFKAKNRVQKLLQEEITRLEGDGS
jgi:RNA polymerase sigma-70 factor (ECF subfamily)